MCHLPPPPGDKFLATIARSCFLRFGASHRRFSENIFSIISPGTTLLVTRDSLKTAGLGTKLTIIASDAKSSMPTMILALNTAAGAERSVYLSPSPAQWQLVCHDRGRHHVRHQRARSPASLSGLASAFALPGEEQALGVLCGCSIGCHQRDAEANQLPCRGFETE